MQIEKKLLHFKIDDFSKMTLYYNSASIFMPSTVYILLQNYKNTKITSLDSIKKKLLRNYLNKSKT